MTQAFNDNQPEEYDRLMQANVVRVFSERNADNRLKAIRELYAEDAVLSDPETIAQGHTAINEAVTSLLKSLPPGFVFRATGPAVGHHNLGRLKWQSGPPGGPIAITGMDVAQFKGNLIHDLFVFVEPKEG